MNVLMFMLRGSAWWRVYEHTPMKFPLTSRPGWSFINPVLYPKLEPNEKVTKHNLFGGPPEDPSCVVIASNILAMESPFAELYDAVAFFHDEFPLIFNQLRYVSRYARFPKKYESAQIRKLDEQELVGFNIPSDRKSAGLPGFNLEAALTGELLHEFDNLSPEYRPPVYSELLLDSIEALASSDLKKSILYAAIAAETVAATILDRHYKNILLSQSNCSAQYRVVDLTTSDIKSKWCDPVYDALVGTSSRNQMRKLLHERPLYLLSKSLLIENKTLYDSIISLYKERNKIAHLGIVEMNGESRSHTLEKRASTIRDVSRLFEWYGESGRYPVLDKMVWLG